MTCRYQFKQSPNFRENITCANSPNGYNCILLKRSYNSHVANCCRQARPHKHCLPRSLSSSHTYTHTPHALWWHNALHSINKYFPCCKQSFAIRLKAALRRKMDKTRHPLPLHSQIMTSKKYKSHNMRQDSKPITSFAASVKVRADLTDQGNHWQDINVGS